MADTEIFDLSANVVSLIIGALLPLLVGFVTKSSWSSKLKGFLLITLSAVTGLVVTATREDGTAVFTEEAVLAGFLAWVAAVATHFGVWKPSGASATVQAHGVKD